MFQKLMIFLILSEICIFTVSRRCRHVTINGVTRRNCIDSVVNNLETPLTRYKNPFDIMSLYEDGLSDVLLQPNNLIEEERTKEDEIGDSCGLRYGFDAGGRIVGGRRAYKNEFPWMVGIQYNGGDGDKFFIRGGGAIVNKRWIVTAAHVFEGDYKPSNYIGILDTLSTNDVSFVVHFDKIMINPNYPNSSRSYQYDIALLHTTEDMELYPQQHGINSICLPDPNRRFNGVVTVSGYGNLNDQGTQSDRLMTVDLYILSDNICRHVFRRSFHSKIQICAGYLLGSKDSCSGDSGGPLVKFINKRAYLVGVVSFGEYQRCARRGSGAVYTKVTYFLKWIKDNTNP